MTSLPPSATDTLSALAASTPHPFRLDNEQIEGGGADDDDDGTTGIIASVAAHAETTTQPHNEAAAAAENPAPRKRRKKSGPAPPSKSAASPLTFYHAVRVGRTTKRAIYVSWDDCLEQVYEYDDAEYATFPTLEMAAKWIAPRTGGDWGGEEEEDEPDLPEDYFVEAGKAPPSDGKMPRERYRYSRYGALSRDALQKLCRARGIYVRVKPKTRKGRMIELLDADDGRRGGGLKKPETGGGEGGGETVEKDGAEGKKGRRGRKSFTPSAASSERYGKLSRDDLKKVCRQRGIYPGFPPLWHKPVMIKYLEENDDGLAKTAASGVDPSTPNSGGGTPAGPKTKILTVRRRYGQSIYGKYDRDALLTMCRTRKIKPAEKKKGFLIELLEADDATGTAAASEGGADGGGGGSGDEGAEGGIAAASAVAGGEAPAVAAAASAEPVPAPVAEAVLLGQTVTKKMRYDASKYGGLNRDELVSLCRSRKLKLAEKKKLYMIELLEVDDRKKEGGGNETSAGGDPPAVAAGGGDKGVGGDSTAAIVDADVEVEVEIEDLPPTPAAKPITEAELSQRVAEAVEKEAAARAERRANRKSTGPAEKRFMYGAYGRDALYEMCRSRKMKVTEKKKGVLIEALELNDARRERGDVISEDEASVGAAAAEEELGGGKDEGSDSASASFADQLVAAAGNKRPWDEGDSPENGDGETTPYRDEVDVEVAPKFTELASDAFQDYREAPYGCAWMKAQNAPAAYASPNGAALPPGPPPTKRRKKLSWDARVAQCLVFLSEHGHLRIPSSHPELGLWVGSVRTQYGKLRDGKETKMTAARVTELEELGFQWSVAPEHRGEMQKKAGRATLSWEDRYQALRAFRARVGHTIVPRRLPGLGDWVHHQRGHLRKFYATGENFHGMNAERAGKLEEVGFILNVHEYKRNIKALSEEPQVVHPAAY